MHYAALNLYFSESTNIEKSHKINSWTMDIDKCVFCSLKCIVRGEIFTAMRLLPFTMDEVIAQSFKLKVLIWKPNIKGFY